MKCIILLLSFFIAATAFSQSKTIAGKITSDKGDPLPFASIKIKNSKTGAVADAQGMFALNAKTGDVLIISSTGFTTKDIQVGNENNISVALSQASQELTNVIVTTALGIQRQAKELGYATTTISNKTLTAGKSVNVQQALNGKISGLNISTVNSGVFENAKINIRGIRSLTGNNQPMLVVDGAPTPLGYLSSIPPDDVQDLTVLKSAASAAIYGPDAVNGVIIINTKRGGQKPTVTLSSTLEATKVSFFPKLQKQFGAGAGEPAYIDQYGNYLYVPNENQQYGSAFDGSIQPVGVKLEDGSIQMYPYTNDHFKDKIKFWNTGLTFQNSVSIASQDFYVSIEDAKVKGLVPDDELRRTSLRFNGGKKYGKFDINYGLNYILQNYDVVNEPAFQLSFPSSYDGSLFGLVMQVGSNVPLLKYKDWQNDKFAQYSNYFNEYAVSPYWLIGNVRQRGREDDIIGNVDVNYEIMPWLKASARLSTNLAFQNVKNTNAPVVVTDWALANRSGVQYTNFPGISFDEESYNSRINLDYFLSGSHPIVKDVTVKYIAGGTVRQNKSKDVAVGGNNLVVPYLYNVAVRSGDAYIPTYYGFNGISNTVNNYDVQSRLLSAYGSISFNYKEWANVEFTGRNDWDSRLSPQNRSLFYPAANVSLVLSDAIPALRESNIFSYVKLRGAISKSGNVNLTPYALQATYSQPVNFPYGGNAGFTSDLIIPYQNIQPEFVNTREAGIELGFLKDRINVAATYFNQNNTNQILTVSQSSTTGYTAGLANAANFKNYGVEMDLGLTPVVNIGRGRIDLKINATYNNNEVTSTLGNTPVVIGKNTTSAGFVQNLLGGPVVANIAEVGRPAFAFQLTDYVRDSTNGKVIVDPITGLPTKAGASVTRGRSLPLLVVGITPSFSIGDFSLSMTWDYKGGNDFFAGLGVDEDNAGISARSAEYGRQRFVFPNSEYWDGTKYVPNTNIQVQDGNYGFWAQPINYGVATNYFSSAAAWRLREVNISYNIPLKWIGNGKIIKRLTVSAVGKNLLLFVPKSNQWGDPEFNYSTLGNTFGLSSSFQSPASRLFGGSVTVQF